jgi:hypothetical protein
MPVPDYIGKFHRLLLLTTRGSAVGWYIVTQDSADEQMSDCLANEFSSYLLQSGAIFTILSRTFHAFFCFRFA